MSATNSRWSFVIAAVFILSIPALSQKKEDIRTLEPHKPIERELVSGDVHWYEIALKAGQFLKVIVDQRGIDVVVELFGPDARQLSHVDSPNGASGPEVISVLAKTSGSYRLEVHSLEGNAPSGRYQIRIEKLREATTQDRIVDLAGALASARTDDERAALMPIDKKFLTPDLERELVAHGEGLTHVHEYRRALALYQIALEIAEQRGNKPSMAQILSNRGLTLWQMGDYTQALGAYQRSMLLLEEMGDKLGIVRMLYNLGLVHTSQGNYELALEYDRKYVAAAEALGDKSMIARVLPSIGIIYSAQGNYIKAMEYYQKALEVFKAVGDQGGVVAALLDIAGVYSAQNNFDLALEYHQKALTITKQTPAGEGVRANRFAAGALLDIAGIYGKEGNYVKALEFSQKSLEMAQVLNSPAMIGGALGNIGQASLMLGNYAKALDSFQRALKLSEEAGDKVSVAQLLGRLGSAYEALENYSEALRVALQSSEMAKQLGDPETLWYSRMIAGKAYQHLNQDAQARQAFEEAISTVENIRQQVAGGELARESFFEDKISPYQAMVGLLISQNNPIEAFRYIERSKARALLDVLKSGRVSITKSMTRQEQDEEQGLKSELVALNTQILSPTQPKTTAADLRARLEKARRDYEQFETSLYVAHPALKVQRGDMQPIKVEEAADLLPDETSAALEFMVTVDKTYLFVLTRGTDKSRIDLKVYPLDVRAEDLAARAEHFREQLARGDLDFPASARELYDLLLKPAQSQLQGKTALIIVPDGVLWNLPFQALQSMANHYVLEDQSIFYAPSLRVLREMISERGKIENRSQSQSTLLAFGNPAVSKQTAEGLRRLSPDEKLEPLPETEKQVTALAQLYGSSQSRVYTGSEAREDRAKSEAGRYRILQFATHGVLNNRSPMYSFLVLSQAQTASQEDGLLEAREMLGLDLHADLVVLSACETGRGKIGAGEGIIGMSWALFVAGSHAAVVSQWRVESASTTELMLEFHRNLKSATQMTKAKALQLAAVKLMREGKYAHPFYWAGFVVVGDGF